MDCLFKPFKIVVIITNLVGFGVGYAKFHQMFAEIGSTLSKTDDTNSPKDLVRVLYMIIQVFSSVGVIVVEYCLIRELCENNYMYNHCFKCCFIITIVVYCLSALPKSIVNIFNYSSDGCLDKWWRRLTDAADSMLAGLGVLGFQLILYMRVIQKIMRSAGACKGSDVHPDKHNHGVSEEEPTSRGCCCFVVCCVRDTTEIERFSDDGTNNPIANEMSTTKSESTASKVFGKGSNIVQKVYSKAKAIDAKVENLKNEAVNRIKDEMNKKKDEAIEMAKNVTKQKLKPYICKNCQNLATVDVEKMHNSINGSLAETSSIQFFSQCGEDSSEKGDNSDNNETKDSNETSTIKVYLQCGDDSSEKGGGEDSSEKGDNSDNNETKYSNETFSIKVCSQCGDGSSEKGGGEDSSEKGDNSDNNETKDSNETFSINVCSQCGEGSSEKEDNSDNNETKDSNDSSCCGKAVCVRCRTCCSSLLEDRMKCFVITMVLANLHLFVYIVELVMIICFVC